MQTYRLIIVDTRLKSPEKGYSPRVHTTIDAQACADLMSGLRVAASADCRKTTNSCEHGGLRRVCGQSVAFWRFSNGSGSAESVWRRCSAFKPTDSNRTKNFYQLELDPAPVPRPRPTKTVKKESSRCVALETSVTVMSTVAAADRSSVRTTSTG